MVTYSFAELGDWADKTEEQLMRIFKQSIQDVLELAQTPKAQGGHMPVVTSFLRNSLASDLNGVKLAEGPDSYVLALASLQAGDTAFFSWTAEYARRVHYGFTGTDSLGREYNQAGQPFRDNAAAQWQSIVAANAEKVQ